MAFPTLHFSTAPIHYFPHLLSLLPLQNPLPHFPSPLFQHSPTSVSGLNKPSILNPTSVNPKPYISIPHVSTPQNLAPLHLSSPVDISTATLHHVFVPQTRTPLSQVRSEASSSVPVPLFRYIPCTTFSVLRLHGRVYMDTSALQSLYSSCILNAATRFLYHTQVHVHAIENDSM